LNHHKKNAEVGRPKQSKRRTIGKIVPVRFANRELEVMIAAAILAKQSLPDWIRSAAIAAVRGRK
jgi:hypothetical protein